ENFSKPVPSQINQDLKIDFCYVPAQKEESKLLIVSSGTHGIEGFTGSAVQQMMMDNFLEIGMLDNIGILFIHAVNPYGFKFLQRTTENNVDINRNCDTIRTLFSTPNDGYIALNEMLNPSGKVSVGSIKNKFFMLVAIKKLMQESKASLRQAILQGQYEFPKGIYFGGKDFEPQLSILSEVILDKAANYDTLFNIDLHTGYGARGVLHLFPNPTENQEVKKHLEQIFEGDTIDWGDSDDFYTMNGQFSDYIGKLLPRKFYLPMSFEYGTLNSQNTLGLVKSLHNSILENQGIQYGYKNVKDSLAVMKNYMEMFYPSSETWRSKIMNDTYEMMELVFERY
ncbi:MAG: DUF2817 domain-containing protein, partial [Mariniphaga sp.]|nr:DUF2817 domain-containing protein [Mariniphaga sp.]